MEVRQIDDAFLRSFFSIPQGEEGEAELAEIRGKLIRKQFRHGQDICTIDGEADGMFFLESGTAVVLDREGQQINIMHPGQYFGEYAVLSGQRRLSTVRSHGTTVVFQLSAEDMMEILRRHPNVYSELMKRVYAQVTRKHKELISLTRLQRGILQYPGNQTPMTPRRVILQYGALALLFILSIFFIPSGTAAPVFLLPLALMIVYVLISRQTLESLLVAGLYAALLIWRSGAFTGYTDALLETIAAPDNVFTVFVMALLGAFVALVEASGAVTAFKKYVDRKVSTARGARFAILGILAITAIDDCLNLICASGGTNSAADEQRVPCEDRALLLSFLPTVLCSFLPISLWAIFVIGSISPNAGGAAFRMFLSSIPFNFYSIVVLLAMVLFCFDRLPRTLSLRRAKRRVAEGGELWPAGSERFLLRDDGEVWGRLFNLLLPMLVLGVSSLTMRSLFQMRFAVDSACGLVAALIFMFLLYCAQGLMSPEQFGQHLIRGIQSMALPIILYLLTMCFATLLSSQSLEVYFGDAVVFLQRYAPFLPAALFLICLLLAMAFGSCWAMYAIAFPVAIRVAVAVGMKMPLFIGAVCAAGIAGEYCCVFTSLHNTVGEAIGCNPAAVRSVRLPYAVLFALLSLLLYLAAGFLLR